MAKPALKVVEGPSYSVRDVALWPKGAEEGAHSLHYLVPLQESFPSALPAYFIGRYSKRGEVVLDPFSSSGTVALESALLGRVPVAVARQALSVRIARAKLDPADITEVTLWLQSANLSKPIALEQYRPDFSPFFDIDTFREVLNLRSILSNKSDRVSRFIEAVTLGILHGHSAGFLSAYTFPQIALSAVEQERLNNKRLQNPEYRAVSPRILRKAALVGRDGFPSLLEQMSAKGCVEQRDARDLSFLLTGAVDLVVTAPPLPGLAGQVLGNQSLRNWLCGTSELNEQPLGLTAWFDYMNEVLLELARVVRSGGRAALDLRELSNGVREICLDVELAALVTRDLSRYWEPELSLVHQQPSAKLRDSLKERDENRRRSGNRVLLLRRR